MKDSNEPFEIAKEKLVSILESCKGKTLGQVDKNNVFAIKAYKKNNFEEVDYLQFIRKN